MITTLGITLLVGLGLGVVLGVPVGRAWERVSPKTGKPVEKKKKKKL